MNFFSGFRAKFQKRVTPFAFSIKFAKKKIRKLPKILKFVRIIHYYSKLFTGVLGHRPLGHRQICLAVWPGRGWTLSQRGIGLSHRVQHHSKIPRIRGPDRRQWLRAHRLKVLHHVSCRTRFWTTFGESYWTMCRVGHVLESQECQWRRTWRSVHIRATHSCTQLRKDSHSYRLRSYLFDWISYGMLRSPEMFSLKRNRDQKLTNVPCSRTDFKSANTPHYLSMNRIWIFCRELRWIQWVATCC